jgi:hypothetical protein
MFVLCIDGLCIENQHCALGFVNICITNAALVIHILTKPSAQCWFSMHNLQEQFYHCHVLLSNDMTNLAMPWLRTLLIGLSVQWLGFSPLPVHVRFMVDKVALKPHTSIFLFVLFHQCCVHSVQCPSSVLCTQCAVSITSATYSEQLTVCLNNTITSKWHVIFTTVRVVGQSVHLHWAVTLPLAQHTCVPL